VLAEHLGVDASAVGAEKIKLVKVGVLGDHLDSLLELTGCISREVAGSLYGGKKLNREWLRECIVYIVAHISVMAHLVSVDGDRVKNAQVESYQGQ